ncbi:MAG: proprotein convertase P-domain-containing protein [Acidimicrobiia bacterium]|nr:proprotein convertase P-domain-containing protein [Acidimicrobiia bacterium]
MKRLAILTMALALATMLAPAAPALDGRAALSYVDFSTTLGGPIPDNDPTGVFAEVFTVSERGIILDLNVSIDITHSRVGDLLITLEHYGTGVTRTLVNRPGVPATARGCLGDNISITLDDEATPQIETMCLGSTPTLAGTARPNNSLSVFDGHDLNGSWILTVKDRAAGNTGSLAEVTMHFGVETCDGKPATILGTSGDDILTGGSGDDVILGREGNDTINGGDGADTICGNKGDDTLDGGNGQDALFGGNGRDRLAGGDGADSLDGGEGQDTADYVTATGPVTVDLAAGSALGSAGADVLVALENAEGSSFADLLLGSGAANTLRGGDGDDRLQGRGGNDTLFGGPGNDSALGGPGSDSCTAETETGCEA